MIFSWFYLFIFLQFIYTSAAALIPLVTTLAGTAGTSGNTNGEGTNARFYTPRQGDISPNGTIFIVADFRNHLIRKIIISTSTVSTLAGQAGVTGITNGAGTNALFYYPASINYSPYGIYALVTDTYNHLIRKIIISTVQVTTIAGGGSSGTSVGNTNGAGTNALFNYPYAICISPQGVTAVVADTTNNMIRMIIISTSVVSTLAGQTTSGSNNGIGTLAKFNGPTGVDYFPDGSAILITDFNNHLIRKIIISTAEVTTVAGTTATYGSTNGFGTNARFFDPVDIRISPDGSYALVADWNKNIIRSIILSTSFVDTIVGTTTSGSTNGVGTNALLNSPRGVSIAPNGEYFLISDSGNHMIRSVNILDHPNVYPRIFISSSPPSDLSTCNMGDEKTDTSTTMVYLVVFCVLFLVLFLVIIRLIFEIVGKMTKADEKLQISRNETTELRDQITALREQTSHGLLKHDVEDLKLSFQSEVKSCLDLVVALKQDNDQLKQSLLAQEHETTKRDKLISDLQADIVRKVRELEEYERKFNGV